MSIKTKQEKYQDNVGLDLSLVTIADRLGGIQNSIDESGLDPREVSHLLETLSRIDKSLSSVSSASVEAEECGATPLEYIGYQLSNINAGLRSLNETIQISAQK